MIIIEDQLNLEYLCHSDDRIQLMPVTGALYIY